MVQYILASTGFGQLVLNKETHISSKSSKHVPLTDSTTLKFWKKSYLHMFKEKKHTQMKQSTLHIADIS